MTESVVFILGHCRHVGSHQQKIPREFIFLGPPIGPPRVCPLNPQGLVEIQG